MTSSTMLPRIDPTTDPYAYLRMIQNPDGSITRLPDFLPTCAASSDPSDPIPFLSKDVSINQETKTWARLFIPRRPESTTTKLPLIVYYHGSGFVVCSPANVMFHKLCSEIVKEIPAVIVSVGYRLAPEHRLPAAYDDGTEALHWIQTSNDDWLTKYADFSKCFLMGSSAGGNIAYQVGLRVITSVDRLMPIKIKGLILHQPFFGGVERTQSELRLAGDKILPLVVTDLMWDLSLPIGTDRDHEYCNPMKSVKLEFLENMKKEGWKVLITGCDGDLLIDREIEFVRMLKERGVNVIDEFTDGGCHGLELVHDSKAKIFYGLVKDFVVSF